MNPDLDWERRYLEKDTPWDHGTAAPSLNRYLQEHPISGRVLVPGCGRGHEVRALAAQLNTQVVGLDLSATAIAQALASTPLDLREKIEFLVGDFFRLPAALAGSFTWLVEHTCFCALEPSQRPAYVQASAYALPAGGKIFAIFYLDPETESGPPFGVTRGELETLFTPSFNLLQEWVPQVSFPGRENRELVQLLQKR